MYIDSVGKKETYCTDSGGRIENIQHSKPSRDYFIYVFENRLLSKPIPELAKTLGLTFLLFIKRWYFLQVKLSIKCFTPS